MNRVPLGWEQRLLDCLGNEHVGQLNLRSALNLAILREFAANGIAIPFPQREVRIVGKEANALFPAPGEKAV